MKKTVFSNLEEEQQVVRDILAWCQIQWQQTKIPLDLSCQSFLAQNCYQCDTAFYLTRFSGNLTTSGIKI